MPALATVALALGVRRMARENALVRKLPSVETLGSVSVICTDKTGTLTTGEMRVREVLGSNSTLILTAAASCCDAELGSDGMTGTGDSTEIAILIEASSHGVKKAEIENQNPRIVELPFDSIRKRMSIQRKDGILYVKGAFESVIPHCCNLAPEIAKLEKINNELTSRGLRVLVIATGITNQEEDLTYLGMIGIADPPRKEVKQAILDARQAGIRVVMITGDHLNTAVAIAKELGILQETDKIDEFVHARATPEEKLKIIRNWKAKGDIVAMTGDGVNDAPALKEAHIGVAMGKTGTEVTRQAADLILADDRFSTIILAVKEGRGIYNNIRKALKFLLAGNCGELFVVVGASIMGLPLPFLAVHLLWINLVTDSLPALALIMDPVSPTVMKVPPRPASELLLGLPEWKSICLVGILEGGVILLLFFYALRNFDLAYARNLVFPTLVLSQLFIALSVGVKSNIWLIAVSLVTAAAQLSLHFISFGQNIFLLQPLKLLDLSIIFVVSQIPLAVIEANKWFTLRSSKTIKQRKVHTT